MACDRPRLPTLLEWMQLPELADWMFYPRPRGIPRGWEIFLEHPNCAMFNGERFISINHPPNLHLYLTETPASGHPRTA